MTSNIYSSHDPNRPEAKRFRVKLANLNIPKIDLVEVLASTCSKPRISNRKTSLTNTRPLCHQLPLVIGKGPGACYKFIMVLPVLLTGINRYKIFTDQFFELGLSIEESLFQTNRNSRFRIQLRNRE